MSKFKPEQGEMVLVNKTNKSEFAYEFIAMTSNDKYLCWNQNKTVAYTWDEVFPRPKKWYDLKENIGKAIMVRDDEYQPWLLYSFKRREGDGFMTELGVYWKYARPLTPEDYKLVGEV